jgi:hypothetical protein
MSLQEHRESEAQQLQPLSLSLSLIFCLSVSLCDCTTSTSFSIINSVGAIVIIDTHVLLCQRHSSLSLSTLPPSTSLRLTRRLLRQ